MTDLLIKEDVVAFIGPDESCLYEALVASAWNLPMISYVSMNPNCFHLRLNFSMLITFFSSRVARRLML